MAPWEASRRKPGRNWPYHLLVLLLVLSLFSSVRAQLYFAVSRPSASTSWANGSPYPFSWNNGLNDGLESFDVELTRLSQDGLILIAQNVPTSFDTLNILLEDVPEGDDYFVICLDSRLSFIYAISDRFTITNASAAQNPSPDPSAPTVTISGAPDPLKPFATTLGPSLNDGSSLIFGARGSPNPRVLGFGGILVLCAVFLGGVITLF